MPRVCPKAGAMKVTKALVRRFLDAYRERVGWMLLEENAQAVLEHTLRDVPEPNEAAFLSASQEAMGRAFYVDVVRAEARIAELEAKLEKVRAWLKDEAIEASAYDRLYAILDQGP